MKAISCLSGEKTLYLGHLYRIERNETHLKSALSSENPEARASTAAGVPIFRRANIAR